MASAIEVKLWGVVVGHLGYAPGQNEIATFEYSNALMNSPVELSPIKMPNRIELHSFPDDSQRTFKGLPGIFADSLPDKFGNQIIDIYMAEKGVPEDDVTALDRLMYVGDRAMGAIEYHPVQSLDNEDVNTALDLKSLSELAGSVLKNKEDLARALKNADDKEQAIKFIRVGSSAGGARSKALIALDKDDRIFDGTANHGIEHTYWLLKFDGADNKDRDGKDPKGMTRVEYIYGLIAKEIGIDMPNIRYMKTGDDFHFMIERFDRIIRKGKLDKLHYASWCGLAHADRDTTGSYSYEQLILVARQLKIGHAGLRELFNRAVFNIIGRNQDDHTKNFGFLMDREGRWKLSPAFDMTYSYDPTGKWTSKHQIRLNGKQGDFEMQDLIEFGKHCDLKERQVIEQVKKTQKAFSSFAGKAAEYGVPKALTETVANNIRHLI